ncbi:MAG: hypothetical protein ACRCZI_12245 [Cetobacterium sp.]
MDLKAVRHALAEAINAVPDLRVVDHVPDQIPVGEQISAVALVQPAADYVDYHKAFAGGLAELHYVVQVVVLRTDPTSATDLLDDFLSAGTGATRSIFDALRSQLAATGGALNGVVDDCLAMRARNIGPTSDGPDDKAAYLSASIDVTVYVKRST